MIASAAAISEVHPEAKGWKAEWRDAFRHPHALLAELGLLDCADALGVDAASEFPFRVPRAFASRMRPGDPADPLLLQVLSRQIENQFSPGASLDPVGDQQAKRSPGLLHKYQGRVLLVTTGSCAVHCRYCFRRHYPYQDDSVSPAHWDAAVGYLSTQTDVEEVLLSGGDPLSLDTPKLRALCERLKDVPRLQRLRIHTRLPIVLPARIDPEFLRWLGELPWQLICVLHSNHAAELDADVLRACQQLRAAGVTLLNQAVLLRGVNDSVAALKALSEGLFAAHVLPYYLHQLDRVKGADHFAVTDSEALALISGLRAQLPGYLVPRLVREIAGEPNKTVLA